MNQTLMVHKVGTLLYYTIAIIVVGTYFNEIGTHSSCDVKNNGLHAFYIKAQSNQALQCYIKLCSYCKTVKFLEALVSIVLSVLMISKTFP